MGQWNGNQLMQSNSFELGSSAAGEGAARCSTGSETASARPDFADLSDRHTTGWESAWIDIGGEG